MASSQFKIHAAQEAAKTAVIKKIYRTFKPEKDPRGKVVENTSFTFKALKDE